MEIESERERERERESEKKKKSASKLDTVWHQSMFIADSNH